MLVCGLPYVVFVGFIAACKGKSVPLFCILCFIPLVNVIAAIWLASLTDASVNSRLADLEQVFERGRDYITRWINSGWIRISDTPLYPSTIASLSQAVEFLRHHGSAATRYLENSPSIDPTEEALRVYESQTI